MSLLDQTKAVLEPLRALPIHGLDATEQIGRIRGELVSGKGFNFATADEAEARLTCIIREAQRAQEALAKARRMAKTAPHETNVERLFPRLATDTPQPDKRPTPPPNGPEAA